MATHRITQTDVQFLFKLQQLTAQSEAEAPAASDDVSQEPLLGEELDCPPMQAWSGCSDFESCEGVDSSGGDPLSAIFSDLAQLGEDLIQLSEDLQLLEEGSVEEGAEENGIAVGEPNGLEGGVGEATDSSGSTESGSSLEDALSALFGSLPPEGTSEAGGIDQLLQLLGELMKLLEGLQQQEQADSEPEGLVSGQGGADFEVAL